MSSNTANAVRQNDRMEYILSLASEGKSRKEIAEILGYKDVEGLYAFVRRKNYTWNPNKRLYELKGTKQDDEAGDVEIETGRVASVITMCKDSNDIIEIARSLKFDDVQAMADFMKEKGYIWDNNKRNYVKQKVIAAAPQENLISAADIQANATIQSSKSTNNNTDILQWLAENKDKLEKLLEDKGQDLGLPRYVLLGSSTAKTVHINNQLGSLIKEFSYEKSITQKDLISIALVEFLKNHGFSDQVKTVLHV